jgi:hypothetical protein
VDRKGGVRGTHCIKFGTRTDQGLRLFRLRIFRLSASYLHRNEAKYQLSFSIASLLLFASTPCGGGAFAPLPTAHIALDVPT